ncbi:MAG: hypothetical protein GY810_29935 [Aureispira sp.]|nr:hypothetical protein [Aureispira sp.]
MANQKTSHRGMWAISLVGLFVSFAVFGTNVLLGDLVDNTIAPYFMLFGIGALMALGPVIYLYTKLKNYMGAYLIEQIILFTTHFLILTCVFRWLILTINAGGAMEPQDKRFPLLGKPNITVHDFAYAGNPANTALVSFAVQYDRFGIVNHYKQGFDLNNLDYIQKSVLDQKIGHATHAKVRIQQGLLGFDFVFGDVILDFDDK